MSDKSGKQPSKPAKKPNPKPTPKPEPLRRRDGHIRKDDRSIPKPGVQPIDPWPK